MNPTTPTTAALPPALTIPNRPDSITALWRLTPADRVEAMWTGRLTLSQLCAWSARRPQEVPLLGDEFAWIVMRTPEWADAAEEHHDNVIHLPERSQHRAAA